MRVHIFFVVPTVPFLNDFGDFCSHKGIARQSHKINEGPTMQESSVDSLQAGVPLIAGSHQPSIDVLSEGRRGARAEAPAGDSGEGVQLLHSGFEPTEGAC